MSVLFRRSKAAGIAVLEMWGEHAAGRLRQTLFSHVSVSAALSQDATELPGGSRYCDSTYCLIRWSVRCMPLTIAVGRRNTIS
jgi:hypothetical protein